MLGHVCLTFVEPFPMMIKAEEVVAQSTPAELVRPWYDHNFFSNSIQHKWSFVLKQESVLLKRNGYATYGVIPRPYNRGKMTKIEVCSQPS